MATPQFTLGVQTLLFTDGIQLPGRRPLEKMQALDRTAGGDLQVEDLGVTVRRFPLVLRGIDAAKMAELETWFDTIADGATNSFTYSDENGTDYTVLWVSSILDFRQIEPGIYTGDIMLEVTG